jgi:bacteriocin biosynthesis cyclodehydratase domain-containing protein
VVETNEHDLESDTLLSLSEGLDFVVISDNEVLVQFGTRSYPSELLHDTDLTGILGRIIARLRTQCMTVSDLLEHLRPQDRAEACVAIKDLLARGFLSEANKSPIEQYLNFTFKGDAELAACSVSLIGAGPIGVRMAHSLLQHGVGRIALLDERNADDLWLSAMPFTIGDSRRNEDGVHRLLGRQLINAGFTNVEALDERLDNVGIETAVAKSQFVVLALEQPNRRLAQLVNRSCIRQRKPWLLATIDGNFGLVGPLFVPVDTACYNDFATLSDAATRTPQMSRRYRQYMRDRGASSFFPGLPVYAEIVAGYASLASIHFLLRNSAFALGRVLTIDFDRMLIDVEDVLKLPRCPVCGDEKITYQPPISAEIVTRYGSMKNAPQHDISK